jgi:hemolysin activation/secretion protein
MPELGTVRSSVTVGADYKNFGIQSLSTNLSYYDTWADSLDNPGTRGEFQSRQVIPLDANSVNDLFYVPLSASWSASRPDRSGSTSFSISDNLFLGMLSSGRRRFQAASGQADAGGTFTTVNASLGRDQRLGRDWVLSLRASGQWASAPLISNEQFALGGTSGVRGYEEGEEYGDTGWRLLSELRTPALRIGDLPRGSSTVPLHVRGSLFTDLGARYLLNAPAGRVGSVNMAGTGLGVLLTGGEHFETRLTLGWALRDSPGTPAGSARAYFSMGLQF